MKKLLTTLIAIIALVLASGCVQPPVCGNGIVEQGEECETDEQCLSTEVCEKCECVPRPVQEFTTIYMGKSRINFTNHVGLNLDIPFYYKLILGTGPSPLDEAAFWLDNQIFYYRCDTTDQAFKVSNGDRLNGVQITVLNGYISTDYGDVLVEEDGILVDGVQIAGVYFDVADYDSAEDIVSLVADGYCQFSSTSFTVEPEILTVDGRIPLNERLYYDDDYQNIERLAFAPPLDIKNPAIENIYKYKFYVTDEGQYKKVYLLHDMTEISTELKKVWYLLGTVDRAEGSHIYPQYGFYMPAKIQLGTGGRELVALLYVKEDGERESVVALVDTATGDLIEEFDEWMQGKVGYIAIDDGLEQTKWISKGTAETGYGSEISISVDGKSAKISVPEESEVEITKSLSGLLS